MKGMTKTMLRTSRRGFTLIELVLVIAILGVLAVAALPRFFNISLTSARTNAMNATAGSIQAGLSLYGANQLASGAALTFPTNLEATDLADGTAASTSPLFGQVLQNPISSQWFKVTDTKYAYDTDGSGTYAAASDTCFIYAPGAGTFIPGAC